MGEPAPLRIVTREREQRIAQLQAENASLSRALYLMHDIGVLVNQSLDLRSTLHAVLTGVTAGVGLGLNRALLFLTDDQARDQLRCVAAVGPGSREEADRIWKAIENKGCDLVALHAATESAQQGTGFNVGELCVDVRGRTPIALALREKRLVQGEGDDDLSALLDLKTCLAAPVRTADRTHGVLYADNLFTGRQTDAASALVFAMVAEHAGRAIENARRYERAAHEARTDALTGLGHHGAMMEAVLGALANPAEAEKVGVAMIDVDFFKRVNDTYGHLAGDALLAELSARLRECCRAGEEPFRYGGEEFAVVLRQVHPSDLPAVGERFRRAVADTPFRLSAGVELPVTCSIGLSCARDLAYDARSAESLIGVADASLLQAKQAGRNRVITGRKG